MSVGGAVVVVGGGRGAGGEVVFVGGSGDFFVGVGIVGWVVSGFI